MSKQPIGIFDSGIGGTSIFKEIHHLLPNENIIYLADSKNAPYGNKTPADIINLSEKNTDFLIAQNCKLIVVACNTATTNAISHLRKKYNIPFIGIEPAIKPASLQTKTKAIGILATRGTLSSALFHETMNLYSDGIIVVERNGEGIVPLIEAGKVDSIEMTNLITTYTKPMLDAHIDYLVLGCTHYPYLIPQLLKIIPKEVTIIDSGNAVARQTKAVLEKNKLLNMSTFKPNFSFYSNHNTEVLKSILDNKFSAEYLDF